MIWEYPHFKKPFYRDGKLNRESPGGPHDAAWLQRLRLKLALWFSCRPFSNSYSIGYESI